MIATSDPGELEQRNPDLLEQGHCTFQGAVVLPALETRDTALAVAGSVADHARRVVVMAQG